jgi:hypothetical protein
MSNASNYRPLPPRARSLLEQCSALPRLIAHLTLTHDVAAQLLAGLQTHWPQLTLNRGAVLFGAAIHDIGKTVHPEELRPPGRLHEAAGEQVLLAAGISPALARFCRTHGEWNAESPLEDLLVALADKVWKGRRDEPLEQALVDRIVLATGDLQWKSLSRSMAC